MTQNISEQDVGKTTHGRNDNKQFCPPPKYMPYGQGSRQFILKLNQESNTLGKQNTQAASLKGKQEFKVCNDPK